MAFSKSLPLPLGANTSSRFGFTDMTVTHTAVGTAASEEFPRDSISIARSAKSTAGDPKTGRAGVAFQTVLTLRSVSASRPDGTGVTVAPRDAGLLGGRGDGSWLTLTAPRRYPRR